MPGPESKWPNLDSRTIIIVQRYHPSHEKSQLSITKVSKATGGQKTITWHNNILFSCFSLAGHGFFWWGSLPMYSFKDPRFFCIVVLYPLSLRDSCHSANTWEKKEKRWFIRGFCEPGLEVAPITALRFHWTELKHMTTSSCKGNIVPKMKWEHRYGQIFATDS